jgi:hypothetical protein
MNSSFSVFWILMAIGLVAGALYVGPRVHPAFRALSVGLSLLLLATMLWNVWARRTAVDKDALVIQQLQRQGSDLTKAHSVEFFLYFPSEQAGATAAERIRAAGFVASVSRSSYDQTWLCLATKDMVLTPQTLRDIRTQFEALASSLGGEYDGWGTNVLRPGPEE